MLTCLPSAGMWTSTITSERPASPGRVSVPMTRKLVPVPFSATLVPSGAVTGGRLVGRRSGVGDVVVDRVAQVADERGRAAEEEDEQREQGDEGPLDAPAVASLALGAGLVRVPAALGQRVHALVRHAVSLGAGSGRCLSPAYIGVVSDLGERLRARGKRLTSQRERVLAAVGRLGHATPDEIVDAVAADGGRRRVRVDRLPRPRGAAGAGPGRAHPRRPPGTELPPRRARHPPARRVPGLRLGR